MTVEALHGLRLMNVDTALDDFGTGFSSLTSIEQLPLSRVKLDRSVIAGIDSNPRSTAIVHSMIHLCRNLGLQVTIEGVERLAQLDFLADCGEVSVQGFLLARPAEAVRRHRPGPRHARPPRVAAGGGGTERARPSTTISRVPVRMLRRHRR